jgi:hypothetical protein
MGWHGPRLSYRAGREDFFRNNHACSIESLIFRKVVIGRLLPIATVRSGSFPASRDGQKSAKSGKCQLVAIG